MFPVSDPTVSKTHRAKQLLSDFYQLFCCLLLGLRLLRLQQPQQRQGREAYCARPLQVRRNVSQWETSPRKTSNGKVKTEKTNHRTNLSHLWRQRSSSWTRRSTFLRWAQRVRLDTCRSTAVCKVQLQGWTSKEPGPAYCSCSWHAWLIPEQWEDGECQEAQVSWPAEETNNWSEVPSVWPGLYKIAKQVCQSFL